MAAVNGRGFVYVATGTGYVEEALRSAASLRAHHPAVPIALITDQPTPAVHPFTEVLRPAGPVAHKPIDKLLAIDAPYSECVLVDSDTFVLGDLTPLFELLDRFDLAAHQDVSRGWDYELPGVPAAFSEFNTGVIAFRNTPAMADFFRAWRRDYDELHAAQGLVNDQPAFRRALYHSNLRVAPLPSEYHFLANVPNYTMWQVRLIHARGDYPRIARLANEELGPRVYVPDVGIIRPFRGRRHGLIAGLRTAWRLLRLVIRPPSDYAAANPRQWWREEPRRNP